MLKFIATYPLTIIALTTLAIIASSVFQLLAPPVPAKPRVTIVDLTLPPLPPPVDYPPLPPPMPVTVPVIVEAPKPKSEVPHWVLKGIAKVETSSTLKKDGTIIWKDRRKGTKGDSGVFQMTPIAFKQIAKRGDSFSRVHKDPAYARELAERYLAYLWKRHGCWHDVIAAYNAGTPGRPAGRRYLRKVLAASKA